MLLIFSTQGDIFCVNCTDNYDHQLLLQNLQLLLLSVSMIPAYLDRPANLNDGSTTGD